MIRTNERVRIKTKGGEKFRGRVIQVEATREAIGAPGQQMPGPARVTIVVELEASRG